MLTYLLPSVVDISGAGIKRTVVFNYKKIQNIKSKQSIYIFTCAELNSLKKLITSINITNN